MEKMKGQNRIRGLFATRNETASNPILPHPKQFGWFYRELLLQTFIKGYVIGVPIVSSIGIARQSGVFIILLRRY